MHIINLHGKFWQPWTFFCKTGASLHNDAKTYLFRYFYYGKFTISIPPALRFCIIFCKFDHFQRGRQSKFCFHHHLKRVCQKTMEITTGNWNKVCHLQNIPPYVRIIYENRIMYFRFVTTDTSLVIESCFLGTLGGFTGSSTLSCCFSDITTGAAVNLVR